MSFAEAVQTMAVPLRLWVLWLTVAMVAVPLILLMFRATRRDGVIVLASTVAVMVSMHALYQAVGFVRLLGLPHVVIWGPLAVWLAFRLRDAALPRPARAVMAVFLLTICVSLVFDVIDVARWVAGARESMLPERAG
ncbi:hypothetical protein ACVDG3_06130 [Meridianimarinicoccus sp. RP-17]|uniref:hypothetical protein n=1 Tax=Meridianimarinicoccus zhengii TaxID=2056810 RepID=UPI000DACA79E|nr:hypothetical protein [Phycocomes zhengii]